MTEQIKNKAVAYLDGAINAATTSVPVIGKSNFPTGGDFDLVIDSEIIRVTAVSGNTLTVTRGASGSTAASHAAGARLGLLLTKSLLDGVTNDRILKGTFAARPASGDRPGQIYETSDTPIQYVWNGSTWLAYGPHFATQVPNLSQFTWTAQEASTTTTNGFLYMQTPGLFNHMNLLSTPVTRPFTATVGFLPLWVTSGADSRVGIATYDVSANEAVGFFLYGMTENYYVCQYPSVSSGVSNSGAYTNMNLNLTSFGPLRWLRIINDSTSGRTFQFSNDGVNFRTIYSGGSGTSTPTRAGFFVQANGISTGMAVLHWSVV